MAAFSTSIICLYLLKPSFLKRLSVHEFTAAMLRAINSMKPGYTRFSYIILLKNPLITAQHLKHKAHRKQKALPISSLIPFGPENRACLRHAPRQNLRPSRYCGRGGRSPGQSIH